MSFFPFISLGIGAIIGINRISKIISPYVDSMINAGLVILMLTLGLKIGSNDSLVHHLGIFGFRCFVTAFLAIAFSVLFTFLLEKTLLPLKKVKEDLVRRNIGISKEKVEAPPEEKTSILIWIMPICIILGIIAGYLIFPEELQYILGYTLTFSLIVLYVGVGISFGMNRSVFLYIKVLSWKILLISVAILAGSLAGGYISGLLLNVPSYITVTAAGGMSYYSITGAYLTQAYGIEVGAYGFLVNVMREFLTVLLLPLLIKISLGSPIASGAAGNMDTMLVPVTKFTGQELGVVTLITGTILTFLVPFLLPALTAIMR